VHADQVRLLRSLTRAAPAFVPNTLVVLIDHSSAFETTLAFRHALLYLYGGDVNGYAWGKWDFGYPARLVPGGVVSEPLAALRGPWRVPSSFHRFDEIVVVHQPKAGAPRVLDAWPSAWLPPLPEGARYSPRERIRSEPPAPPQRRILEAALLPRARATWHTRSLADGGRP
jgi:hypothetical protein